MEPVKNYENKDENSCDVKAAETLFELRCFRRKNDKEHLHLSGRKMCTFIAYMSKKCGADLLGKQSPESAFREKIHVILRDEKADEKLRDLFDAANARERQILLKEVGSFAGVQVSVRNGVEIELKKAEEMTQWQTGQLKRDAEDPLRIITRAVAPTMQVREPAGVAVMKAGQGAGDESYFASVRKSMEEGLALPAQPADWAREDAEDTLMHLYSRHLQTKAHP